MRKKRWWTQVAGAFALPLAAPAALAGESHLPPTAYVAVGSEIQRYDYSGALRDQQAWVDGTVPCLRVEGARIAGPRHGAEPRWLGATREEVLLESGIDVEGDRVWDDLLVYDLCRDDAGGSVRWRTAADDVSFRFSWSGAAPVVRVNGLSAALPATDAESAEALERLFSRLRARDDFYRAVGDFERLSILIGERFEWPAPGPFPTKCGFTCAKCSLSLVVLVAGGGAGIIAGCNPVSTGATAGASCVGALAGVAGATFNAIESCLACDRCLHPPDPDQPPGGGGSSGCKDPSGCCPPDYHECCNNQCCSDVNPPSTCE